MGSAMLPRALKKASVRTGTELKVLKRGASALLPLAHKRLCYTSLLFVGVNWS